MVPACSKRCWAPVEDARVAASAHLAVRTKRSAHHRERERQPLQLLPVQQRGLLCRVGCSGSTPEREHEVDHEQLSLAWSSVRRRFVEESGPELLRKVALLARLSAQEQDEYVHSGMVELRKRLNGWPPEPPATHIGAWTDVVSSQLEQLSSTGPIVLRRTYETGPDQELLFVIVEAIMPDKDKDETSQAETDADAEDEADLLKRTQGYRIRFYSDSAAPLQLHWGVIGSDSDQTGRPRDTQWLLPPEDLRPSNTFCDEEACNTDLGGGGPLQAAIVEVTRARPVAGISFVLRKMKEQQDFEAFGEDSEGASSSGKDVWLKAPDGGNFYVPLPSDWVASVATERENASRALTMLERIAAERAGRVMYQRTHQLHAPNSSSGGGGGEMMMVVVVKAVGSRYQVEIVIADMDSTEGLDQESGIGSSDIMLHWGLATGKSGTLSNKLGSDVDSEDSVTEKKEDVMVSATGAWVLPPDVPSHTSCDEESCETQLVGAPNLKRAILTVKPTPGITGVSFVLKVLGETAEDHASHYIRDSNGDDFHVPVPAGILQDLSREASTATPSQVAVQRLFALGRDGSHGRLLALVHISEKDQQGLHNTETANAGLSDGSAYGDDDGRRAKSKRKHKKTRKKSGSGGRSEHDGKVFVVEFFSDSPEPLVLHWGVSRKILGDWHMPKEGTVPFGSTVVSDRACETVFQMAPAKLYRKEVNDDGGEGDGSNSASACSTADGPYSCLQRARLHFQHPKGISGLTFVVRTSPDPEVSSKQIWFKDHWENFVLPFHDKTNDSDDAGGLNLNYKAELGSLKVRS